MFLVRWSGEGFVCGSGLVEGEEDGTEESFRTLVRIGPEFRLDVDYE